MVLSTAESLNLRVLSILHDMGEMRVGDDLVPTKNAIVALIREELNREIQACARLCFEDDGVMPMPARNTAGAILARMRS